MKKVSLVLASLSLLAGHFAHAKGCELGARLKSSRQVVKLGWDSKNEYSYQGTVTAGKHAVNVLTEFYPETGLSVVFFSDEKGNSLGHIEGSARSSENDQSMTKHDVLAQIPVSGSDFDAVLVKCSLNGAAF
jgi:hypothetical protein